MVYGISIEVDRVNEVVDMLNPLMYIPMPLGDDSKKLRKPTEERDMEKLFVYPRVLSYIDFWGFIYFSASYLLKVLQECQH